jgi:CheY-like chemotaxis protein
MSNKTRVLNVRVVGFSAPERQMLNSIFLLSVAPARQIGYKLWNPETGTAPDMYLLDGDSESAVASWQATFASTSDRTLVVGAKNLDLGVASASRPLGLKVVGAMDRLAIALGNKEREAANLDISAPAAGGTLPTSATLPTGTLPTGANSSPAVPRQEQTIARVTTGMTAQQPALSASMNGLPPMSATPAAASPSTTLSTAATLSSAAQTLSSSSHTMTANSSAAAHLGAVPGGMTAAAPAANVLPNVTLQPNMAPPLDRALDRSINEKPVPEKTVDKILSEKSPEKSSDKTSSSPTLNLQMSGVTPLSPSALSAAVAPSASRVNLRVVTPPPVVVNTPPLAASLPTAARIADAPMQAPPPPVARIADAPMQPPPVVPPAPAVQPPPAVIPQAPAQMAPNAPSALGHGAQMARHEEHNFRVLVVDDSPLMRTFMQNKLSPYGISPEFASSGEEALFKISKQHFDLIFLDVMLPGMDGYDVCKVIKKNKDNALMKVVMLTSKDKTFDKIRGTMAGCDSYLTKPVDEMKLRAIIERHSVSQK